MGLEPTRKLGGRQGWALTQQENKMVDRDGP